MADLGHGRGWLTDPAAASIARIDREIGHPLQITEAGRTWARQNEHWETFQRVGYPIALHPDTPSIHQLGCAIDSDEAQRFIDLMARHGWRRTVYRKVGGVWKLVEPWHFEYFIDRDQHRNEPAPAPVPDLPESEEDDMKHLKWGIHHFLIRPATVYYISNPGWIPYINDHYGAARPVDNGGFTLELVVNAIPWDAVDATLKRKAFGSDRQHWSRLEAEGIAIRGVQSAQTKTLEDVLKTARAIESETA